MTLFCGLDLILGHLKISDRANITPRDGDQSAFLLCHYVLSLEHQTSLRYHPQGPSPWLKIIFSQKPKPFDGEADTIQAALNGGVFMTLIISPKAEMIDF